MPEYGKRTGLDVTDNILTRLAELEDQVRRLKGSPKRSAMDRGDTDAVAAPLEGQTMVQYDTDRARYYANGEWRDFTSALSVQDGFTNVFPTTEIQIPRSSAALVDSGGGVAFLKIGHKVTYTPTLAVQTGTDPTNYTVSGLYYRVNDLVFAAGQIAATGSEDPGVGIWRVSLPHDVSSFQLMGCASISNAGSPALTLDMQTVGDGASNIGFVYPKTWPVGALTYFSDSADWTFSSTDVLDWFVVYTTSDSVDAI